ncbi:MAG TPA: hypothetical protein VEH10_00305, partial [Thermoplasmata archaeon]|nr:hypothetical protein [Thermoplasmata archaeon]
PVPVALALLTFVFVVTSVGELPGGELTPTAYAPSALSATLFSSDGAWVLLLGVIMLTSVSGAIYLVREGRG